MTRTRPILRVAYVAVSVSCGLTSCSLDDGVLGGLVRKEVDGHTPPQQDSAVGTNVPEAMPPVESGAVDGCPRDAPRVLTRYGSGGELHETCAAALAETTFLNALCTCHDLQVEGDLQTRGFDSSIGPFQDAAADDGGAAVGVNGDYAQIIGLTDVGGSLALAGPSVVRLLGVLQVRGDWKVASDVLGAGTTDVARNAWLGASFVGGPLTVGGELHYEGTIAAPVTAQHRFEEQVSIPAPCACGPESLLDIGGMVDQAATQNDNHAASLDSAALSAIAADLSVSLPCGRYYLNGLSGTGDVTLDVVGRSALFIDGSVNLLGNLEVRLSGDAELDIFVRRDLRVTGQARFGDRARPAATRLYIGGSEEIALAQEFVGNMYAPLARATVSAGTTIMGSLFVSDVISSGSATFWYDRAVLRGSKHCNALPIASGCTRCGWCSGGTACVDNTCAPCRTDEDCCSQFVCSDGSCVPLEIR